jgi:spermidine synthase
VANVYGEGRIDPSSQSRMLSSAVFSLFFFSGFTALSLQTTWSKVLGQVIGIDYVSQVVVVSIFMLGLGLGAWLGGWITRSFRRPLLFFAAAELLIAAFAATSDTILHTIQPIVGLLSAGEIGTAGLVWDFVIYSALLLPAIALMGTSLPIVVHSLRKTMTSGVATGRLYTVNVIGAVVGCYVSGTFLIGAIGIKNSLLVVAAINTLIAVSFLLVIRRSPHSDDERNHTLGQRPPALRFRVAAISFLIGFTAIAAEVLYFRVFTFYFGATSYVFPIILGSYLIHIAIGSSITASLLSRGFSPIWIAKASVMLSAGLIFLPFMMAFPISIADKLILNGSYGIALFDVGEGTGLYSVIVCGLLSFVMLAPVSALSMSFPALVSLASDDRRHAGSSVAFVYFTQTLGNFAGSLAVGALLVPSVGVLASAAILCAMLGLTYALVSRAKGTTKSKMPLGISLPSAALLAVGLLSATPAFYSTIRFKGQTPERVTNEYNGTVLAHPSIDTDGSTAGYRLNVGAEPATSYNSKDRPPEAKVWPVDGMVAALGRPPKSALIIGIGTGDTAITLRRYYPDIKITIVELLDTVITEMQERGSPELKETLASADIHVMDGARFINRIATAAAPPKFDLIQIGVFHVISSGAGNLFTKEFVEGTRRILSDDGVVTFNAYAPTIAALRDGPFDYWIASRGEGGVSDVFLSGKEAASGLDIGASFQSVWKHFCSKQEQLGINNHEGVRPPIGAFILADKAAIGEQLERADVPSQTNDHVVTEYFLYWPISVTGNDPRFWKADGSRIDSEGLSALVPPECS